MSGNITVFKGYKSMYYGVQRIQVIPGMRNCSTHTKELINV